MINEPSRATRCLRPLRCCALILAIGCVFGPNVSRGFDPANPRSSPANAAGISPANRFVRSGFENAAADAGRTVESIRKEGAIPGMSAAVWIGDGLAWSEAFGLADLEHDVPVTRETRFRLGSCSKILTATLTATLLQSGKVDLDRDIREYLPSFPRKEAPITLRQLLGHLAGIRHYTGKDFDSSAPGGIIDLRPYPNTESALALFKDDPLIAPPGEKYSYSTFGYTLIAAVLEAATKKPFLEFMHEELLSPLELTNTGGDEWQLVMSHRTSYYEKSKDGKIVHATPVNQAYKWAGGGLLSTADDLARFGSAHFSPGLLDSQTLTTMFTPQESNDGKETGVGLGWRIGTDSSGRRLVHHAGSMGGCRAVLVVYPTDRIAVAILSNLAGTPDRIKDHAEALASTFRQVTVTKGP
jgi:CubicO group peptidase (beta-lactamase class C family)